MAHFAQLDENNIVIQVIVVSDEVEADGENWCAQFTGGGVWKKTSYNTKNGVHELGGTPFRKNYAGIGYTYDAQRDAFIPPKPYNSWVLNEFKCDWEAPTPMPDDLKPHFWDEQSQSWLSVLPPEQLIPVTEV